jgi:hypothetical protein
MLQREVPAVLERPKFVGVMDEVCQRVSWTRREITIGGPWDHRPVSDREALFLIYEQALVATQEPVAREWVDPALECLGRSQSAIVMTAYNPGTDRPSWAENEAANERMQTVLIDLGYEVWPADGFSADGTWREPGWLVWGMSVEQGAAIAADFGQFAVYAYDSEGVRTVVACD